MIGYVTKQDDMGLNQKRFYRTKNLAFKETELTYMRNTDNLHEMVNEGSATLHKSTKRMTIFRIQNRPQPEIPKQIVGQISINEHGEIVAPELPAVANGLRVLELTQEEIDNLPF